MSKIDWYKRDEHQQLFGVGALMVSRWTSSVDITMLRDQNTAQTKHTEKVGHRVPILALIEPGGRPSFEAVNEEFRRTARELAVANEKNVLAIAYVIASRGFVGSITRSIVTGINLAMRPSFGTNVVSTVEEAISWLEPHMDKEGHALDRETLEEGLEAARKTLSP